ncbi:hypothetical protein M8J77_006234 [Diaphorina citri]|nr:hypothetical protein M8J77_006234 [Diaphorina citri]
MCVRGGGVVLGWYSVCGDGEHVQWYEENKIYAEEARLADEDAIQRSALLWQLDDQEVVKYAQQVHQECIDKGRPELPVLIALENYKKANRLVAPRQKNLTQWESNVFPKPVQIRLNKSVP